MLYKQENDHYITRHLLIIIIVVVVIFLLIFVVIVVVIIGFLFCLGRGFSCRPRAPLGLLAVRSNVLWTRWTGQRRRPLQSTRRAFMSSPSRTSPSVCWPFSRMAAYPLNWCCSTARRASWPPPRWSDQGAHLSPSGETLSRKWRRQTWKKEKNRSSGCSWETQSNLCGSTYGGLLGALGSLNFFFFLPPLAGT